MNLIERFSAAMQANAAEVFRVATFADAMPILTAKLADLNLTGPIRLAPSIAREWPAPSPLACESGTTDGTDPVCLSRAWMAIADTGTLVLQSGPENPTRLNFLADFHGVFLQESKIVETKQAVWKALEQQGKLPRALNFISGPSRTADIEQTIQLGAHGPRSLWIFIHP